MKKNTYTLVSRFNCCGKVMVTVIIHNKAACVMEEAEWMRVYGQWYPERWKENTSD